MRHFKVLEVRHYEIRQTHEYTKEPQTSEGGRQVVLFPVHRRHMSSDEARLKVFIRVFEIPFEDGSLLLCWEQDGQAVTVEDRYRSG